MSNLNKKLAQIKKDKNLTNQTQEGEMSLTEKLEATLNELKQVMEERRDRIENLRQEIVDIETENQDLQHTIELLLETF
jgi:uncharacterized membrane protein